MPVAAVAVIDRMVKSPLIVRCFVAALFAVTTA